MHSRSLLAFVLCLLPLSPAVASESLELARKGSAAWSAFECVALASKLNRPDDQKRLFEYGYDQGLQFIAALQAGKIKREDVSASVPIGVTFALQGPNPDFMLGRMYESAVTSALKDVFKSGDYYRTESEQDLAAASNFADANCDLIGGGR